jgi:hypothetical protein
MASNVAEKDTTVTVPMAKFFKNVKVNGIQGTVTFHAGPHIGMANEALNAKIGSGSK